MTNNVQAKTELSTKNYNIAQEYLKSQIVQPKNLSDLKRNANLKYRQVELARANGDLETAAILAYEHQRILQDIDNYNK